MSNRPNLFAMNSSFLIRSDTRAARSAWIVLVFIALILQPLQAEEPLRKAVPQTYLLLVELIWVEENPPSNIWRRKPPKARVTKVFSGPEDLLGVEFALRGSEVSEGQAEDLVTYKPDELGFRSNRSMKVGAVAVVIATERGNPVPEWSGGLGFPYGPLVGFYALDTFTTNLDPVVTEHDKHAMLLEWAEYISKIESLEEQDELVSALVEGMKSDSGPVAISAVHLAARWMPDTALPLFKEMIRAEDTTFLARLAMDHELVIRSGKQWVESPEHTSLGPYFQSLVEDLETTYGKDGMRASEAAVMLDQWKRQLSSGRWKPGSMNEGAEEGERDAQED